MKKKMLVIVALFAFVLALPVVSAKEVTVSNSNELYNAVINATSGDKIILGDDITYSPSVVSSDNTYRLYVKTDITLDLNNHKIEIPNATLRSFTVYGGSLDIIGKGSIIDEYHQALNVWGTTDSTKTEFSTLKVGKDVTLKGLYGIAVLYVNSTDRESYGVSIDFAGTIEGKSGISINGLLQNTVGSPVINVLDGAKINVEGNGIYGAGYGVWTIGNVEITGKNSAIAFKAGKVTINGGTYTCTGESSMPTEGYSNGINASGATIQLESNKDYKGNVELTINGGTFESKNAVNIYEYFDSNATETGVKSIEITNGKFISKEVMNNFFISDELLYKGVIAVSGGTFSANPVTYLKAGHKVALSEGSYVVSPIKVEKGTIKVSGTITNGANAQVKLIQSGTVIATVEANANGAYEFSDVKAGKYNVSFVKGNDSITKFVEVVDKDVKLDAEIIENVSTTVTVGTDTPTVVVEGVDKIVDEGHVEVVIETEEKSAESTAQKEILAKTENKNSLFLNLEIKKSSGEGTEFISETSNILHFVVSLDTKNKENIELYRYHSREVEQFEALKEIPTEYKDKTFYLDVENNELHIYTDKFSTYGITYTSVVSNTDNTTNPNTFDNIISYVSLLVVGIIGLVSMLVCRKKVLVK